MIKLYNRNYTFALHLNCCTPTMPNYQTRIYNTVLFTDGIYKKDEKRHLKEAAEKAYDSLSYFEKKRLYEIDLANYWED